MSVTSEVIATPDVEILCQRCMGEGTRSDLDNGGPCHLCEGKRYTPLAGYRVVGPEERSMINALIAFFDCATETSMPKSKWLLIRDKYQAITPGGLDRLRAIARAQS